MTGSSAKLYQLLMLGLLFPVAFLNGWLLFRFFQYFQPLVTIFVLASLLAFILNYPVQLLQQHKLPRSYAAILVFFSTLVILMTLGITLIPFVLEEFNEITKVLPTWIDSSYQNLHSLPNWALLQRLPVDLNHLNAQLTENLPRELQYIGHKFIGLALNTIDSISEAILIIVLTFYLLLDGERLWHGCFQKLPFSYAIQAQQSLRQNFENYFIGQIVIASLVGLSMTVMFLVTQVSFGLFFGLGVGVISLIPFGDILSLTVCILVIASHDFWLAVKVAVAAVVIDQVIDQVIAPRILGRFTGLRPVWVLISLVVGTYIGGLLGLVIAVPVAGFIKSGIDGWQTNDSSTTVAESETPLTDGDERVQKSPKILT